MFRKKNDDTKKDENKDLDLKLKLFAELVRLWAHADAYLWNRARTIVGVQGAVLAGGWVLLQRSDHWFMGVLILAGGGILSLALFLMVKRDEQTRDYYAKFFIDPLWSLILVQESAQRFVHHCLIASARALRSGTKFIKYRVVDVNRNASLAFRR